MCQVYADLCSVCPADGSDLQPKNGGSAIYDGTITTIHHIHHLKVSDVSYMHINKLTQFSYTQAPHHKCTVTEIQSALEFPIGVVLKVQGQNGHLVDLPRNVLVDYHIDYAELYIFCLC